MLILSRTTFQLNKFQEIISNINEELNNPIWLNQEKIYFKTPLIYNIFVDYYNNRVLKQTGIIFISN